jgi:hypothetical protein
MLFLDNLLAQALGKETVIIKTPRAEMPSDFNRSEYIEFNNNFKEEFKKFLKATQVQADHYEELSELLEQEPILAIDYLKRAFLISQPLKTTQQIDFKLEHCLPWPRFCQNWSRH